MNDITTTKLSALLFDERLREKQIFFNWCQFLAVDFESSDLGKRIYWQKV
jgi:hypothetical protein